MTQLVFSDLRGGTTTGISTGHFPEIVMDIRYYCNGCPRDVKDVPSCDWVPIITDSIIGGLV